MLRLIENNNILTSDELDVLNREVVWLYYYVVKILIIGLFHCSPWMSYQYSYVA